MPFVSKLPICCWVSSVNLLRPYRIEGRTCSTLGKGRTVRVDVHIKVLVLVLFSFVISNSLILVSLEQMS